MIDIENEIVTLVYNTVIAEYPTASVSSTYNPVPSSFPHICVMEIDNRVHTDSSTNVSVENHADVTFEVSVYSNKTSGAKSEAKEIRNLIDDALALKNFTRTLSNYVPNIADATIYRIVTRYTATADADKTIYRR